jgi:hypothetical protein
VYFPQISSRLPSLSSFRLFTSSFEGECDTLLYLRSGWLFPGFVCVAERVELLGLLSWSVEGEERVVQKKS